MEVTGSSTNTRHVQEPGGGVFVAPAHEHPNTHEVVCSSAGRRSSTTTTRTIYRLHSHSITLDKTPFPEWPRTTQVHCWCCSHDFDTVPVSIPKSTTRLSAKQYYSVYGVFCSINCALRNILDANTHDQAELIMRLNTLCVNVYGMSTGDVRDARAAPPRQFLTKFGGHMSIEEYRGASATSMSLLVPAPFIPYVALLESHSTTRGEGTSEPPTVPDGVSHVSRGLRRPVAVVAAAEPVTTPAVRSRYEEFAAERKGRVTSEVGDVARAPKRTRRARAEAKPAAGGLSGFIQKSRTRATEK